jgi:prepilin-type N-terminal cleavage/methylation domain-containing protein
VQSRPVACFSHVIPCMNDMAPPRSGRRVRDFRGFTILELVVVIVIGGVMAGLMINAFSRVRGQLSTRSAQSNFMGLHAQARAFAVERGVQVRLVVDEGNDRVRIEVPAPDGVDVRNEMDFRRAFGVDMVTGQGSVNVCFTPRGIANPACGGAFTGNSLVVRFDAGGRSRTVTVFPLGQAREG